MVDKESFFNLTQANLKRAFRIPFLLAIILVVCFLIFDVWADFMNFIQSSLHIGDTVWYFYFFSIVMMGTYSSNMLPLLAALPFSASYCEEQLAGITPMAVARSSRNSYCVSKILVCALAGGLTLFCGILLHMALFSIRLPLVDSEALRQIEAFPYTAALKNGTGIQYFIIGAYLAFLRGALFAVAAMTVSAFILNKYVTIASPLILNFVLVRACNLLQIPNSARLDLLLRGRSEMGSDQETLLWLTVIILILIIICGFLFQHQVKRRIANEFVT